jgi:uncharacterized protein Smg (DUF494 family)
MVQLAVVHRALAVQVAVAQVEKMKQPRLLVLLTQAAVVAAVAGQMVHLMLAKTDKQAVQV